MGNGHKGSVASLAWSPTVDNPQVSPRRLHRFHGAIVTLSA
jgi:hypothetical protein